MISIWGVDHGEISKGWAMKMPGNRGISAAAKPLTAKGKKGVKAKVPGVSVRVPGAQFKHSEQPPDIQSIFRMNADEVQAASARLKKTGTISKSRLPNGKWVRAADLTRDELRNAVRTGRSATRARQAKDRKPLDAYAQNQKTNRKMINDIRDGKTPDWKTRSGQTFLTPNREAQQEMKASNIGAFAVSFGGRKGEKIMVVPKGATPETVDHEIAHLTPKRSSYRLQQIIADPKRISREEARAEMSTNHRGGYYKNTDTNATSGYGEAARSDWARRLHRQQEEWQGALNPQADKGIFTSEGMKRYRETQDKIHQANPNRLPPRGTKGYSHPKFRGNQHVDDKGQKRSGNMKRLAYLGGGTAAGGAGYGAYRWNQRKDGR